MLLECVPRREDQRVELPQSLVDGPSVSPDLGRTASVKGASDAGRLVAGFVVVFPEQMHRADEPVLVGRHHPHRRPTHVQYTWAADERDVVKMDDVGIDRVELLAKGVGLEVGAPRGLRGDRREQAEGAFEAMDVKPRRRQQYGRRGWPPRTALKASAQWKTWTSCPRLSSARDNRSTYAASPPKLWPPKNVVTMQNFNGDLLSLSRRAFPPTLIHPEWLWSAEASFCTKNLVKTPTRNLSAGKVISRRSRRLGPSFLDNSIRAASALLSFPFCSLLSSGNFSAR